MQHLNAQLVGNNIINIGTIWSAYSGDLKEDRLLLNYGHFYKSEPCKPLIPLKVVISEGFKFSITFRS
ncbi:hypothetical protein MXB_3436 [Myxobolus squamalis]|nr:hypothetical protein MXB_3436 [Myxobolus squamalis]